MKNLIKRLTPKTTWCKINLALTVVLFLAYGGLRYMEANIPAHDPGCPPGDTPTCPGLELTFFPHPKSCSWYFQCINGVAYCKECPVGLHWNVNLDSCDYPDRAQCDKDGGFPFREFENNCTYSPDNYCVVINNWGQVWANSNYRNK